MDKRAKIALISSLVLITLLALGMVMGASRKALPECKDGIDNDGDGYKDYPADPGCTSKTDNDETNCGDHVCEGGETYLTCHADCPYPDSCSDSEGGQIYNVSGTTSGYYSDAYYSHTDYCIDTSSLKEYYCSGSYEQNENHNCGTDYYGSNYCSSGDVYRTFYDYYCSSGICGMITTAQLVEDCQYGCTSGSCNAPPDSCYDSDSGITVYVAGTVSGYIGGTPYSYDDYCIDGSTLSEWYCDWVYAAQTNTTCNGNYSGCSSGACY